MGITNKTSENYEVIKKINFGELARTEELGQVFSFKDAAKGLEEIAVDFVYVIENGASLKINNSTFNQVEAISNQVVEYAQKIKDFKIEGNEASASQQRKDIHQQVENIYQKDLEHLQPMIDRIKIHKFDIDDVVAKASKAAESVKELERLKEEAKILKDEATKNVNEAIKEVRGALGKEGALISVKDFEEQAREHLKASSAWLKKAYWAIAIFVILATALFANIIPGLNGIEKDNYPDLVRAVIFKIVLLSVGSTLIYQSIKNFRINRHLYVLNRHRQLSLSVYPFMVQATNNPEQANIITNQASKAIFEPGTSGHLDGSDNPNPVNFTEIINKFADK